MSRIQSAIKSQNATISAEDRCYREILAGATSEPVKYLGEPPTVHWDAFQLGGEVSRVDNCEEQQHDEEEDVAQYACEPAEQAARNPNQSAWAELVHKVLELLLADTD